MQKPSLIVAILSVIFLTSCSQPKAVHLKLGSWKGKLHLMEEKVLPFNFEVSKNKGDSLVVTLKNGAEQMVFDDVIRGSDSLVVQLSVFDGTLRAKATDSTLTGFFIEENLGRKVPFTARFTDEPRFLVAKGATYDVSGIWEVDFEYDKTKPYKAKGIFDQNGNHVTGTFRTKTGDYRYLEGVVEGDQLKLSTFDGTHAFLFQATLTDSTLLGKFYVGNHKIELFTGKRNLDFELPDANQLTALKEDYETLDFSFPNTEGELVGLSDNQFKDKVVLVQLLGTWCPNCFDETRFYVEYLKKNPNPNVQVIALAFEYAKTKEKAFNAIKRFRKKLNVEYPVLLAQYGGVNKQKASEKLPMLDKVRSYPTTIFIDKKGKVRKIHTGFNGPATGEKYEEFKKDFYTTMETLLSE